MSDSQSDAVPFHKKGSREPHVQYFFYRGPSMAPTFKLGQILHVKSQTSKISQGDIIVFQFQDNVYYIVHRIIFVSANRFITRGDNNLHNDPIPVTLDQIIGRVEYADCGRLIRPVHGGRRGLWLAWILRLRLLTKRFLKKTLNLPYSWIKKSRLMRKFWKPEIEIVYFASQEGELIKFVHSDKTVAKYWSSKNQWWFRLPYGLIIGPDDIKKTI